MADRYWVGGAGTWNASTTTNWSATSGGAGGASAPTSADNVIFNASSDAGSGYTVTVVAGAVCNDLTMSSIDIATTVLMDSTSATATLDIHGSMLLPATNLTLTITNTSSAFANINFKATTTGKTINTNGKSFALAEFSFNGIGGGWTQAAALTVGQINLIAGTFNTGNFTLGGLAGFTSLSKGFTSSGTNTKVVNLGSSTVTINAKYPFDFLGSNLTFNTNTSFIFMNNIEVVVNADGITFRTVVVRGFPTALNPFPVQQWNSSNTFSSQFAIRTTNLTPSIITFLLGGDLTVGGVLELGDTQSGIRKRISLFSSVQGTQRTITANGTVNLRSIDLRDIKAAGTAARPWSGQQTYQDCGDCGGNSDFTFKASQIKYYRNISTSGNFSDNSWALLSTDTNGDTLEGFPLAQDTAIFDNSSGSATANLSINMIGRWNIGTIDCSARTSNFTITFTGSALGTRIYKNINLGTKVVGWNTAGGNPRATGLTFCGRGLTQVLDVGTGGVTLQDTIEIDNINGTVQLARNTICNNVSGNADARPIVKLTSGTLDLNNKTLTCPTFLSSNSNTRAINFGTGKIIINDTFVVTNPTFIPWDTSNSTGLSITGTPVIDIGNTLSANRTITTGTLSENNSINFNIQAGTYILTAQGDGFRNLDFTGSFTGTLANSTRKLYGNLTLVSGMTLTGGTEITTLAGTSGTQTITSNGRVMDFPVIINGGSTVSFIDALTLGSTRDLLVSKGIIKFKNGVTHSAGSFSFQGDASNQVIVNSTLNGSQFSLIDATGTNTALYATIKDSVATGGAIFNAFSSINDGNNIGWFFLADSSGGLLMFFH